MNRLAIETPNVSSVSYYFIKSSWGNLKTMLSSFGANYYRLEVSKKSLEMIVLTSDDQMGSQNLVTSWLCCVLGESYQVA